MTQEIEFFGRDPNGFNYIEGHPNVLSDGTHRPGINIVTQCIAFHAHQNGRCDPNEIAAVFNMPMDAVLAAMRHFRTTWLDGPVGRGLIKPPSKN